MKNRKNTKNITSVIARSKHHAKMLVLPHKANRYKPHAVRWYGLAIVLVLTGVSVASSLRWTINGGAVLGVQATVTSASLLDATNAERLKDAEKPLNYNEQLSAAAYMKAQDMFKQQYWAHVAPDGTTPWAWFAKAGYNYSYAGENLAKNFSTAGATVDAWMASQTHRANILNIQYTDVGFAVMDGLLDGKHTTVVVALYGQPASAVAGATTGTRIDNTTTSGAILSPVTRFGIAMKTMTPAVLGSVILLLVVALIALTTYAYRRNLPRGVKKSWRIHHTLYEAVGLTAIAIAVVTLYSGGQI